MEGIGLEQILNVKKAQSVGYLKRKLNAEIEVFQSKRNSLVEVFPVVNVENTLVSCQKISTDGRKLFAKGQKVAGAFYPIGNFKGAKKVILCEGVATGHSIARCTGQVVLCVLSVGNFEKVYLALKEKLKEVEVVFAADNDHTKEKNVGLETVKNLSAKYGLKYVAPKSVDPRVKDFNDVEQICGRDLVEQQFKFDLRSHVLSTDDSKDLTSEFDFANYFFNEALVQNEVQCAYLINDDVYFYGSGFYDMRKKHELKLLATKFFQKHPDLVKKIKLSFLNSVLNHVEALLFTENKSLSNHKKTKPDFNGRFLVFKNGIGLIENKDNPEEIKLIPHSPEYFSTSKLPYNYNSEADCPEFKKFLTDVLPDESQQKLIWEWFGYNLLSDVNFGKALMLIGEGANGKSVITTVLVQLLGSENTTSVGLDAFDHKRTFPLAAMTGKLANIVEDVNEIQKVPEGILKSIITGGQLTVERKNNHPQTVVLTAKQTFAANNFPRFSDNTDGIYRRFIVLPMTKQILDPNQQDKRLVDPKFWQESGELSGVLNEALKGLARLLKQGHFTVSESSSLALSMHRLDNNPARQFLTDNYHKGVEADEIFTAEVYEAYKEFCAANGYHAFGASKFSKEVQRTFNSAKRSQSMKAHPRTKKRGYYYMGLKAIEGSAFVHKLEDSY